MTIWVLMYVRFQWTAMIPNLPNKSEILAWRQYTSLWPSNDQLKDQAGCIQDDGLFNQASPNLIIPAISTRQ